MFKNLKVSILLFLTLNAALAPLTHADQLQRQRLRDLGDRLVFQVEGGNHPEPAHRNTDRYDLENAVAKSSALAGITYTNRVIESDMLTMDNRRFQVDLNNIGRSLDAGHVMLAGPHGKAADRVPLAIPEGTSDRCIGPCLQAFRYCTNQPAAAAINRYMTQRERKCLYWFFRKDLNEAIQDAIQSLQPGVAAVAAAAPAAGLGPMPLPGGAARGFRAFGDAMMPNHTFPGPGGAGPVAVGVAGAGWVPPPPPVGLGALPGLPAPGTPAPAPAALRVKRNTAPILVIALGTPTSFYSHNPKKYIGYHFDGKRPPIPVLNQPRMQPLVSPQPAAPLPGGAAQPLPAPGSLPGGPDTVGLGPAWAIPAPPAANICTDYLTPAAPVGGVPMGGVWPATAGAPGVWAALPAAAPPVPAATPAYKLQTIAGGAAGCSDFDLKIYSPDLSHLYLQEMMRLRASELYTQYFVNGVYLLPATGALPVPAPVIPVGNPPFGLPNRVRMVESWEWIAAAGRAVAIGAYLGAPPIAIPGPFAPVLGAAALASPLEKGEFETILKPLMPFNPGIVDDGKIHVFKNAISWASANIPVVGGPPGVPATSVAGVTGIGVYEVFPALGRFAFEWTAALGREVDLKLEFTYDASDYSNTPGGPIAVLNDDIGNEDTPDYARLWPTPCAPAGC